MKKSYFKKKYEEEKKRTKKSKTARTKLKLNDKNLFPIIIPYKFGRPTKYDPKFCEYLLEHMALGMSFESFAGRVGVHNDTLYEWVKTHPDFSDAKKTGTDLCRMWWESEGRTGHRMGGFFNATSWIYNVKCRFPKAWGDKVSVEADVNIENLEGFEQLKPKVVKKSEPTT